MSDSSDPRVRRTHERLREAMVELTLERGYGRTRVRDVLERADVARSTFYAHFEDKFDLMFGRLTLFQLEPAPDDGSGETPLPDVARLFAHTGSFVDLYRALRDGGDLARFQEKARRDTVVSLTAVFGDLAARGYRVPEAPAYLARFYGAALLETLFDWLERGTPERPAEMADRFQALLRAGLLRADSICD